MSRLPRQPLPPARGARTARFVASLAFMVMVVGIVSRHLDLISSGTMYAAVGTGLVLGLVALGVLAMTIRDVWREGRGGADSAFGTLLLIIAAFSPLIGAAAAYVAYPALGCVDKRDSQISRGLIQGFFFGGGSLGLSERCERRCVGDH